MARFCTVDVHPYGGHVHQPWTSDVDTDAFAKTARRVCEAYSRVLVEQDLHGKSSTLLLHLDSDPSRDHVHVVVLTDHWEGSEAARVTLPAGIAALGPQARALLVLDVVHGAALRLAQARAMDASRLNLVQAAVLRDGLRFVWRGPTKASPDRRHHAQVHVEMADDGYGRARIVVRRRSDGSLVGLSDEQLAYSSSEGFARAARTLRWRGAGQVELTAFSGWLGETFGTATLSVSAPAADAGPAVRVPAEPAPVVAPVVEDLPRPHVAVEGRGADAPEGNDFPDWIQGGVRHLHHSYRLFGYPECLDAMVDALAAADDWKHWWRQAGEPGVDMTVHALPVDDVDVWPKALQRLEAVTARRFADRVEVRYRTTAPTSEAPLPEVAQWVRRDLERAIAKIRARFRLTVPPELPHLDEAALGVARARAEAWARKAKLRE